MPIPSFPNCYWVAPGRLLAGEYPGDKSDLLAQVKLAALQAVGVRAFIDLTGAEELRPYAHLLPSEAGVSHQRFPIRDISTPHSPAFTRSILDAIDLHLAAGRLVYVHCWGGVGRTGVIVGCWLARQAARAGRPENSGPEFSGPENPGAAGFTQLQRLWRACPKSATRSSPETEAQEAYILNWRETP